MVTYRITTQIVNPDGSLGELVDIVEMESSRTPATAGCFSLVSDYNSLPSEEEKMSATKYLAAAKKLSTDTPNWGNLSVDQQAWELAKVCFNGQNPTLSAIALRAQTIKEAILSGELQVSEIAPAEIPYFCIEQEPQESEMEMERRTR